MRTGRHGAPWPRLIQVEATWRTRAGMYYQGKPLLPLARVYSSRNSALAADSISSHQGRMATKCSSSLASENNIERHFDSKSSPIRQDRYWSAPFSSLGPAPRHRHAHPSRAMKGYISSSRKPWRGVAGRATVTIATRSLGQRLRFAACRPLVTKHALPRTPEPSHRVPWLPGRSGQRADPMRGRNPLH